MKTAFEPEGDLRSVDILAGFVALWRQSASGVFRAQRASSSARFDVEAGEVAGVSSSDPRFDTAAILVRAGKLDAAALDRLVAPEGTDRALAALAAGILTKREWRWGEKIRAIEVATDLLMWADGSYTFDPSARPQAPAQELALPIPRLLLELFLRSRDRDLVEHQLGDAGAPLARSDNFDREFSGFGLTADAESVVRLIDGRATAAEIAQRAPADEFAVRKLLAALVTLDLVRPGGAASGAPAAIREGEEQEVEGPWPGGEPLISGATGSSISEPVPELSSGAEATGVENALPFPVARGETQWEEPASGRENDALPRLPLESVSGLGGWERLPPEPLDRALDVPAAGPDDLSPPRGRGALLAWIAGLVVAGAAAFLLLKPRETVRPPTGSGPARVMAPPSAISPIGGIEGGAAEAPAVSETDMEREAAEVSPPPSPVSALPERASPKAASPSEGARQKWLDRAEKDRGRLASEPATAYAIQLELACEVETLEKAWTYDRPAGSLWLLTAPHAGRTCFKVLWGRYNSLEAARDAKAGIPSFFTTGGNRPAVVAVR